jgi:glycerol-3-phosphate dehydrogenase
MKNQLETQVLIIGGGVAGTSTARELSKYNLDVVLIEKNADFAPGQSKCNHGHIHPGIGAMGAFSAILKSGMSSGDKLYDFRSPRAKLSLQGFELFDSVAQELDLRYISPGVIIIARDDAEVKMMEQMVELTKIMADETDRDCIPKMLDRKDILDLEPNITPKVLRGLYDEKWIRAFYPWEYVIALGENAKSNGIKMLFNAGVNEIVSQNGGFIVQTAKGPIKTEFIINASGRNAAQVAQMAGVRDFELIYNSSQAIVLDKHLKGLVTHLIQTTPLPGVYEGIIPTLSGNIYVYTGTYNPTPKWERENTVTRREWFIENIERAQGIIPSISQRDIITSFVGVRAWNTRDPDEHIVESSKRNPKFINMVLRLPGMAFSTAAAKYVVELLSDQGLELTTNKQFNPYRKAIPVFNELSLEEKDGLIASDARYGHIVCRCETVTEGEIVEAIKRGATTVQGLQFRTRAGMGRCQRGFCGPRVVEILSKELGIPKTQVTFKGPSSEILKYRSKELWAQ